MTDIRVKVLSEAQSESDRTEIGDESLGEIESTEVGESG